jgi:hypothetical protein
LCPDALAMGCAPAGTRALGEGCVWSAAGAQPGSDNCVAGALCASDGVCRDICGFGSSPPELCAGGLTCFPIPGRFEPQGGGDPQFGACAPPL